MATIFIDFDDTLFPTHWYTKTEKSERQTEKFKLWMLTVENTAINLLESLSKQGRITIVTNSGPGWVSYITEKWTPKLATLLVELKIRVVSANPKSLRTVSRYEQTRMKSTVFKSKILAQWSIDDPRKNLLSIGDKMHDCMALHQALDDKINLSCLFYCKTIKMKEDPDIKEIIQQHFLLDTMIEQIFSVENDLEIFL